MAKQKKSVSKKPKIKKKQGGKIFTDKEIAYLKKLVRDDVLSRLGIN